MNIEKITKVSPHSAKIDLSIAIVVFIVKYNYRKLQMRIGECCKTFVKNSQERCSACVVATKYEFSNEKIHCRHIQKPLTLFLL